ncbi:tetratricopeptide repeat protein [uncultured Methanobrevibacter sp.]|uniref:tetratricopeptide repeat protein n=1 Tax=uncultured Methanobrevibacter sp. TaxID=253161 RepID=UPI0025EFF19F|nr:tetratricopeptide repeat protein [uncultured Methanobrevibacter sp.]
MTWEWKIGDPVDDANGGTMDAQNWHGDYYFEEDNRDEARINNSKSSQYSKKAWDYYMDFKDEKALHYINMALDLDGRNSNNWNIKGLILMSLKRYEQSQECFDKSLQLYPDNIVYDNKARMLLKWSANLLQESKNVSNGLNLLQKAEEKIIKAINTLPGENTEEILDRYLNQRDTVSYYIRYEREYQNNLEILKACDKYDLFTITGTKFYENSKKLYPGAALKLLKEPDNEFDSDAIAIYFGDEKVGYVANSDYTKHELTASAFELQDKVPDSIQAEYLFFLSRYSPVQFNIGRIIR